MNYELWTMNYDMYSCATEKNWPVNQWRRSVVKYGGQVQSGQAVKLFQITPYGNDFQNTQQSWFLTACRRLEKAVLPSIFRYKSFILDDVKVAELSDNSFEWKNVTFSGGGSKHTLTHPTYFHGDQDPQHLRIYILMLTVNSQLLRIIMSEFVPTL